MMNTQQLELLCCRACRAVSDTAAFIADEHGKVKGAQVEEKFLNGLVSYVDRQAEQMLVERLSNLIPEAAFLTEEETVTQGDAEFQWIIDPLDGTTNFLYGVPHYSISVGLKCGDDLSLGIVHHVPAGEQFYAWSGGGAWCNGRSIRVSQRNLLRQALVSTGFPYHNFERAESWFSALRTLMEEGRGVRRFGSAALDLAWVACGRFDVFFEYGLNAWDVAGGAVLIREAGGKVCDFSGENQFMERREMLAVNEQLWMPVLEIIKKAFA